MDTDVAFDFTGVWAHDLQGRSTAYRTLTEAGMTADAARQVVGL